MSTEPSINELLLAMSEQELIALALKGMQEGELGLMSEAESVTFERTAQEVADELRNRNRPPATSEELKAAIEETLGYENSGQDASLEENAGVYLLSTRVISVNRLGMIEVNQDYFQVIQDYENAHSTKGTTSSHTKHNSVKGLPDYPKADYPKGGQLKQSEEITTIELIQRIKTLSPESLAKITGPLVEHLKESGIELPADEDFFALTHTAERVVEANDRLDLDEQERVFEQLRLRIISRADKSELSEPENKPSPKEISNRIREMSDVDLPTAADAVFQRLQTSPALRARYANKDKLLFADRLSELAKLPILEFIKQMGQENDMSKNARREAFVRQLDRLANTPVTEPLSVMQKIANGLQELADEFDCVFLGHKSKVPGRLQVTSDKGREYFRLKSKAKIEGSYPDFPELKLVPAPPDLRKKGKE